MACKYREPGSDVWLSEAEFKQKLNEGLIDSFIINNDIKVPKFEANTDLANKFKKEAKESAPSVAEQAAPVTKAAVKEEGTAAKGTEPKASGYSPTDNLFNKPGLARNTTHGWRTMSEEEFNSLSTGEKTYEGGAPKSGNWIAGVPSSAAKFGKKGTVMVEFGGVKMGGAENMEKGSTADRSNVTKVWRFNDSTGKFEESSELLDKVKKSEIIKNTTSTSKTAEQLRNDADNIFDNEIPKIKGFSREFYGLVDVKNNDIHGSYLNSKQKLKKEGIDLDELLSDSDKSKIKEIEQLQQKAEKLYNKADKAEEAQSKPTTSKKGFISTKGNVRGKDIDGYAVRVSEDGKTADVMLPSNKMVEGLKIKETDTGRKYVVAANGATIFMPKAEAITETPKQQTKAEAKVEAKPEAKIRRRLDGIVDEGPNKSSKKAIELKNIVASSPNSFNGSEKPVEAGLINPQGTPMNRVIEKAYKDKEITAEEMDLLLDGLEKTKTRYYAAKAKPGLEEFKDKVANGIRSAKMEEGLTGLNAALYNKVLDLAAKLFEKGMDAAIALSKALDTVLNQEVADGKMTEAEADAEKAKVLSEEGATTAKPRPAVSGIKKEVLSTEAKAKAEMDTQKMSIDDILEAGKKASEDKSTFNGRDARDFCTAIAESTERAPVLNAIQTAALVHHKAQLDEKLANLYDAQSKAVKDGDEKALADIRQDITILEQQDLEYQITAAKTAYEQGLSLFTRRFLLDQQYNLVTMINKYKAANDGEISKEMEEKFRELDAKYRELNKKLEELEKKKEASESEETISNVKAARKNPKKGTSAKTVSSTDGKIKVPTSLIRELAEEGVDTIEELTERVKEAISDKYPSATTRQVRDAISNYNRTINMTEDEVKDKINEMKSIGRLLSELEDLQKGIKRTKNKKKQRLLEQREIDLKEHIKEKLNEIPLTEEEEIADEAKRLEAWKKRTNKTIAELNKKMKTGDFTKGRKRKSLELDEETAKLNAQKIRIQEEFDLEYEKIKNQNRKFREKLVSTLGEIWNAPKALKASLDFSAPFRQGAVFMFTRMFTSPIKTAKLFKNMLTFAAKNDDYFRDYMASIKASPYYKMMKDSGLFIADENAKITAKEEVFVSNLASKIPFLGKPIKVKGKTVIPGLNLIHRSEWAYNGFLNQLRIETFMEQVGHLNDAGITYKTNPEEFKAWAKYVNQATGRGTAGQKLETTMNAASQVLFSPRLVASRVNILTNALTFGAGMPKYARRRAVKNTYGFLAVGSAFIGLAYWAYGAPEDDEDGKSVSLDPLSSDFMKIKLGNIRIDLFAGFQQIVRTIAQFAKNQKVDEKGNIRELGKKYNDETRLGVLGKFWLNKFSPSARYVYDQLGMPDDTREKRLAEEKFLFSEEKGIDKWENMALDLAIPIWIEDLPKLKEEHGFWGMLGLTGLSSIGFGVNVQTPSKPKSRRSSGGLSSGLKSNLGSGLKSNLSSGL